MRDILFRGKILNTGKWVEGYYCNYPHQFFGFLEHYIFVSSYDEEKEIGSCTAYPIIEESVGQFTGVDDTNSTKIFEGDIVQYTYATNSDLTHIGCVVYGSGEFYIEDITSGEDAFMSSLADDDYTYKVIGNIYNDVRRIRGSGIDNAINN